MTALTLDGHLGGKVEIDLCGACHAIWFDRFENLQLVSGEPSAEQPSRIAVFGSTPNTRLPFFRNRRLRIPVPEPMSAIIESDDNPQSAASRSITEAG